MIHIKLNKIVLAVSIISLLVISLSLLGSEHFDLLTTAPGIMHTHQYWRWLSCNFVHFGWAHCLIDVVGFWLVSAALFDQCSLKKFLAILLFCCLAVGVGISIISPEINYAGLSGCIHGLFIAGCFYATKFGVWERALVFLIVSGKIITEQLPGYDINPMHNFMPVIIAIDAHLIGAVAGLVFVALDKIQYKIRLLKSNKQ